MKNIVGITGLNGAGKETAANYLSEKIKFPVFSISEPLVKAAKKKFRVVARDDLVSLGKEMARKFGDDYLARKALEKTNKGAIITGIRQTGQIDFFQNNSIFLLIAVDAKAAIRFERKSRGSRYREAEYLDEFIKKEEQENSGDQPQRVMECIKRAKYVIENNGKFDDLFSKLDSVIIREKDFFRIDL